MIRGFQCKTLGALSQGKPVQEFQAFKKAALQGDRKGQSSIRVADPWNILRARNPRAAPAGAATRLGHYFSTAPGFQLTLKPACDLSVMLAESAREIAGDGIRGSTGPGNWSTPDRTKSGPGNARKPRNFLDRGEANNDDPAVTWRDQRNICLSLS